MINVSIQKISENVYPVHQLFENLSILDMISSIYN